MNSSFYYWMVDRGLSKIACWFVFLVVTHITTTSTAPIIERSRHFTAGAQASLCPPHDGNAAAVGSGSSLDALSDFSAEPNSSSSAVGVDASCLGGAVGGKHCTAPFSFIRVCQSCELLKCACHVRTFVRNPSHHPSATNSCAWLTPLVIRFRCNCNESFSYLQTR